MDPIITYIIVFFVSILILVTPFIILYIQNDTVVTPAPTDEGDSSISDENDSSISDENTNTETPRPDFLSLFGHPEEIIGKIIENNQKDLQKLNSDGSNSRESYTLSGVDSSSSTQSQNACNGSWSEWSEWSEWSD